MLVRVSIEFEEWLNGQSAKIQQHVADRLRRFEMYNHLGDYKYLGDGLSELRFKNGTRIYFYRIGKNAIRIVLGGAKNGQEKDIQRAKNSRI